MYFPYNTLSSIGLLFTTLSSALPTTSDTPASFPVTPHLVHQFPNHTYVNSLAILHPSGDLIVALANVPEIYQVSTTDAYEPIKLASIPNVQAAIGLVEVRKHEFYMGGGNLSVTEHTTEKGSFGVWKLTLAADGGKEASLTKVAALPDAQLLDRIILLDEERLLVADSILGAIWVLDVTTGESSVFHNDTDTMAPISPNGVGVNALGIHGGYLLYDNSEKGLVARMPFDRRTATATGPPQVLLRDNETYYPQGFVVRDGNMWMADADDQVVLLRGVTEERFDAEGVEIVAGGVNDTTMDGPTDVKFGMKVEDRRRGSVYVTTAGRSHRQGGQVWRVDVGGKIWSDWCGSGREGYV